MIGQTLSHYKVIRKLGKGGMGEVYLAEDLKLKRRVALKILPEQLAGETDKTRFLLEAQAAAAINHPNVCTIHEIEEDADPPFIAMEYIDGETLKTRSRQEKIAVETIIDYAIQIAEGINAAHKQDIVHRDIKSDNIMLSDEEHLKVMDFGLAKLKGSTQITKSSSTIGTLAYMAPEQIEGKEIDQRSDIFSFGVVLYEMISGHLPFAGDYEAALMYAIINEQPQSLDTLRDDLPDELLEIVNKAIAKAPEQRYQSIADMLVDLKHLRQETTHISGEQFRELRKTGAKKSKRIYIYASLLILVAAAFSYFTWFAPASGPMINADDRSVAVMYFTNNSGDQDLDHWRRAITDLMIADLSQSKYMKVLTADKLYDILKDLDQLDATTFSAEVLQEVAEKGRVSHIVYGTFSKAGDDIRINIQVKQPFEDELVGSNIVEGKGEESLFPMVDELTDHVKQQFEFSDQEIESDIDQNVANITTSSPEAYKYYTLAAEEFDRRNYRETINYLEKAVSIDSGFAYAYRTMGITYGNMGYWSQRREYLNKALEFSHRVSIRERYLIEADYYADFDREKSIAAFKNLLEVYPNDKTGNINLGYLYNWIRDLDQALVYHKRAIQIDPSEIIGYMNAAWAYTELAQYDSVLHILNEYRRSFEDNEVIRLYFAEIALYRHQYDIALQEVAKAAEYKPDQRQFYELKGDIYLCMDQIDSARAAYESLLEWDEKIAHLDAYDRLWSLAALHGKISEMKKYANEGLKLSREINSMGRYASFLFNQAALALQLGNDDEALKYFEEIISHGEKYQFLWAELWGKHYKAELLSKTGLVKDAQKIIQYLKKNNLESIDQQWHGNYIFLLGKLAIHNGHYDQAIDSLQRSLKVITPLPEKRTTARIYYALGRAYHLNGNLDEAVNWYQKLQSLTIGRIHAIQLYVKSHFLSGQCYQQKGWNGKAIEQYRKFLDYWENSDFPFPEIEMAKKELSLLEKTI